MRALLVLTALSLVFLVGAWFWSESSARQVVESPGLEPAAVVDGAGVTRAVENGAEPSIGVAIGERTPAAVPVIASGLARPADEPFAGGRELTIVDRASGAPMAFADVLQIEPALLGARDVQALAEQVLGEGLEALGDLEVVGRRWQADDAGRVWIARRPVATLVLALEPNVAVKDAARGFGIVAGANADTGGDPAGAVRERLDGAGDTGARVQLAASRELWIDVVNGAGAPVPGALVAPGGDFWDDGAPIWEADADGRVRVYEAGTLLAALATLDDDGSGPTGFMVGILRSARRDRERVDLTAPGSGPLTTTLEALGAALTVQLVDPFGLPMGLPNARVIVRLGDKYPRYELDATGRLVLPALPIALETRVNLHPDSPVGSFGLPEPVNGAIGPDGLELVLTLGAPPAERIALRALDADGQPLEGVALTLEASQAGERGGGMRGSAELYTDGAGRVEHADSIVGAFARTPGTLRLQLYCWGAEPPLISEPIVLNAVGAWPLDLGDVVLSPAAPVLAGRVVVGTGEPLPNARVEVRERMLGESGSGRRLARVRSDAEGRFAVYAALVEPGSSTLTVEAEHPGYGSTGAQPAQVGDPNLELIVGHTGVLVASVRPADRGLTTGLVLRLQPMDPSALPAFSPASPNGLTTSGGWVWTRFDDEGVLELRNLVPGSYRVQLAGGEEVLAEFQDVQVVKSGATRDPRLTKMHLRDHLHVVEVRVVDAVGAPIENVYYLTPGAAFEERLRSPLVTANLPFELTLMAEGYLNTVVQVRTPFVDVVMPETFHVNMRIPAGVASGLNPNLDLKVALVPWTKDFDPFSAAYRFVPFVDGVAQVELMASGRQRVLLDARDATGKAKKSVFFEARSVPIEIEPGDAGLTFDLVLTEGEVEALDL